MELEIRYTNKEVSPWGGLVLLRQMMGKMGFREMVSGNADLPCPRRGYDPATIIEGFMTSVWSEPVFAYGSGGGTTGH